MKTLKKLNNRRLIKLKNRVLGKRLVPKARRMVLHARIMMALPMWESVSCQGYTWPMMLKLWRAELRRGVET